MASWDGFRIAVGACMEHVTIEHVGVLLSVILVWFFYRIAFLPLNRVKTLADVGWSHLLQDGLRNRTMAEAVREAQKLRKVGQLPPVFPNGWFALLESRTLKHGQVKSVSALGETFAVFRAEDGLVRILEAHCPHLGANMAVGGIVKGNSLECPFHGWIFDGDDGKCSDIPYASKVPECAKVRHWKVRECNGIIFVWYHIDQLPASYEIPVIEDVSSGVWKYRGRTEHEVLAHIQEIPENGSDLAHLGHVHGPNIMKGSNLSQAFTYNWILDVVRHRWEGSWSSCEGKDTHIADAEIKHSFVFLEGKFEAMALKVSVKQIGPSLVHLFFDTPCGKGVLIQTVTPMKPLCQKVIHQFYTSSLFVTPIAKLVMLAEAYHVERDIMIWNSKQYLPRPLLVKEDKLISRFRKWYSQFYSDNSPRLGTPHNTLQW